MSSRLHLAFPICFGFSAQSCAICQKISSEITPIAIIQNAQVTKQDNIIASPIRRSARASIASLNNMAGPATILAAMERNGLETANKGSEKESLHFNAISMMADDNPVTVAPVKNANRNS